MYQIRDWCSIERLFFFFFWSVACGHSAVVKFDDSPLNTNSNLCKSLTETSLVKMTATPWRDSSHWQKWTDSIKNITSQGDVRGVGGWWGWGWGGLQPLLAVFVKHLIQNNCLPEHLGTVSPPPFVFSPTSCPPQERGYVLKASDCFSQTNDRDWLSWAVFHLLMVNYFGLKFACFHYLGVINYNQVPNLAGAFVHSVTDENKCVQHITMLLFLLLPRIDQTITMQECAQKVQLINIDGGLDTNGISKVEHDPVHLFPNNFSSEEHHGNRGRTRTNSF